MLANQLRLIASSFFSAVVFQTLENRDPAISGELKNANFTKTENHDMVVLMNY